MLKASDLACIRGGRPVFAGVAFALEPGEALVLRGPNGSGKSSLLRILAGFLAPVAGRLAWQGADIHADPAEHRRRVHYVGHADGVKPVLSVRENLAFAARLAGGRPADIDAALDRLALRPLADLPVRLLSAGQRRRLALARLFAAPRPLWLLDEPGVGLDAASRARLEAAIEAHRGGGGLAVLATHGDVDPQGAHVLEFGA